MKPGKNFKILDRILKSGSLDDVPISTIGGDEDLTWWEGQMTQEEFDKRYKNQEAPPEGRAS